VIEQIDEGVDFMRHELAPEDNIASFPEFLEEAIGV
jgi:hypothetical protein